MTHPRKPGRSSVLFNLSHFMVLWPTDFHFWLVMLGGNEPKRCRTLRMLWGKPWNLMIPADSKGGWFAHPGVNCWDHIKYPPSAWVIGWFIIEYSTVIMVEIQNPIPLPWRRKVSIYIDVCKRNPQNSCSLRSYIVWCEIKCETTLNSSSYMYIDINMIYIYMYIYHVYIYIHIYTWTWPQMFNTRSEVLSLWLREKLSPSWWLSTSHADHIQTSKSSESSSSIS